MSCIYVCDDIYQSREEKLSVLLLIVVTSPHVFLMAFERMIYKCLFRKHEGPCGHHFDLLFYIFPSLLCEDDYKLLLNHEGPSGLSFSESDFM